MYINECIDNDEKLEAMCPSCRTEVTEHNKCTRCGKPLGGGSDGESFINPNFDSSKFEKLAHDDYINEVLEEVENIEE